MANPFVIVMHCSASLVITGLIALALNWLGLLPWRRAAAAHWTEQARRLEPARRAARQNLWVISANVTLVQEIFWPGKIPWELLAISSWIGGFLAAFPFDHRVFPELRFRDWLHFTSATWLMFLTFWGPIVAGILLMPHDFGWLTWVTFAAVISLLVAHFWGLGLWLCRQIKALKPASDEKLLRIVSTLSDRLGVSVRAIWILNGPLSYAAAMTTTKDLIFSERLLRLHSDEEIAAICAHEMGHLSESKAVLAGRLSLILVLCPWLLIKPALYQNNGWAICFIGLTSLFTWMFFKRLARRMEVRADRVANENQEEPGIYAKALEHIYRTNLIPAVMRGNGRAHPHLYDRLLAAGVTPEYPRPKPPSEFSWTSFMMFFVLIILAGAAMHH